jgi:hypothetical protein
MKNSKRMTVLQKNSAKYVSQKILTGIKVPVMIYYQSVLWIRIYFNADPVPSMQIRIRIQGAKPMRIHVDPDPDLDPGRTLMSQKVQFLHEEYILRR